LDYKDDYSKPDFLKQVGGISQKPERIPINVFELAEGYSSIAASKKASSFVDTLSKIYGGIGPKQSSALKRTITELFRDNDGSPPRLHEVVAKYVAANGYDSVSGVLEDFVSFEIFDDSSERTVKFSEFLGSGLISLSLDTLGTNTKMKVAVATLILDMYLQNMMKASKPAFMGDSPQLRTIQSYLLIDEATNIMKHDFSSLQALLREGREFGYGVILSSQFLGDFKTSNFNYAETLETWMIHRVPDIKPAQLQALGMGSTLSNSAQEITALAKHQGLWSSFGYRGFITGTPFYKAFGESS